MGTGGVTPDVSPPSSAPVLPRTVGTVQLAPSVTTFSPASPPGAPDPLTSAVTCTRWCDRGVVEAEGMSPEERGLGFRPEQERELAPGGSGL